MLSFSNDLRLQLTEQLSALGHRLPPLGGDAVDFAHETLLRYYNARSRRIPARPRRLHWSKELFARIPMLTPALQSGLAVTALETMQGTDLTPRLSRQLSRPNQSDRSDTMLNDWGLHHLHLGVTVEANGMVAGAKEILFVLMRPDDAYLIDVGTHHWTDLELVEIVHGNWPHTIAPWRFDNVRLGHPLTPQHLANLRDKNGNTLLQMRDGAAYLAIGGGLTGSGRTAQSVMWADRLMRRVKEIATETGRDDWREETARAVERATSVVPSSMELRLEWQPTQFLVHVTSDAPPCAISFPA